MACTEPLTGQQVGFLPVADVQLATQDGGDEADLKKGTGRGGRGEGRS